MVFERRREKGGNVLVLGGLGPPPVVVLDQEREGVTKS